MELAAPNKLVVDAAGVELVAPNGDVTDEEPPNTELVLAEVANEPELPPNTGGAPNPLATGAALVVEAPNAGGLVAPNVGAGFVPNEGTAPKLGAAVLLLALPKMLLPVAPTGAAVVVAVGADVAAPPKENAPVLLVLVEAAGCAWAPNENVELAADGT